MGVWSGLPESAQGTGYSGEGTARGWGAQQTAGTGTIDLDDYEGAIGDAGDARGDADDIHDDAQDDLDAVRETEEWEEYKNRPRPPLAR